MLAYKFIKISAIVAAAIAAACVARDLCEVRHESEAFNSCLAEIVAVGKTTAQAVHFCNGGN